MKQASVMRATVGRLPLYLKYLKSLSKAVDNISATTIARELGLGEVQVRKDLSSVSGAGRPKTGYVTTELIENLESFLGYTRAVIVGAGKLGMALLEYEGFAPYGLEIAAAFDNDSTKVAMYKGKKAIYSMEYLEDFCKKENIQIGIITVPEAAAQEVCNKMVQIGIAGIWNFAPCNLVVPKEVVLQQENMALSLAYLSSLL